MGDPLILPNPAEIESFGDTMPLSLAKLSYLVMQSEFESTFCFSQENELNQYSLPEWVDISSSSSHDFLNDTLLSDESILKAMMLSERPWEDNHHRSSILPPLIKEELPLQLEVVDNGWTHSPSTSYGISFEGNLSNISKKITIDISIKPSIMETITIGDNCSPEEVTLYKVLFKEFHDIFAWSYEEMPCIDPWIIVHEIKTYARARPVWQKLQLIHLKKFSCYQSRGWKVTQRWFYLSSTSNWMGFKHHAHYQKTGYCSRMCRL
jgi:hypothetical protein